MNRFDTEKESTVPYVVQYDPQGGTLALRIRVDADREQILDCAPWLCLAEEAAIAFTHAFALANLSNRPVTRTAVHQNLCLGFFRWVEHSFRKGQIGLGEFSEDLFNAFDRWLDGQDERGKRLISMSTALHWRSSVATVLDALKAGPYKTRLPSNCRLRRDPFAGRSRDVQPTEPFDLPTFQKFLVAVRTEILEAQDRYRREQQLFAKGRHYLTEGGGRGTRELLLATLESRYGAVLPPLKQIHADDPELYDWIQDWGADDIYRAMHPSQYELLPLAYFLGTCTAFNESTLLGMKVDGIELIDVMGVERIVIKSFKARSDEYVVSSFVVAAGDLNPASVIRLVQGWTRRLRPSAARGLENDFWLYVPRKNSRDRGVRTLDIDPVSGVNPDLQNAQRTFAQRHDLPRIGFRKLRATVAALAHDLFGGDVRAVMSFLRHSTPETTLQHYTSGVATARYKEIIAQIQLLRDRWVESGGKIDPRVSGGRSDPGAATPGFHCLDPFNSPIPGQQSERLCTAYGKCPICPHATVDADDPAAFARLKQLEAALRDARGRVLPQRWVEALAPVYELLTQFWLHLFSDVARSRAEFVYPPPIAPLE